MNKPYVLKTPITEILNYQNYILYKQVKMYNLHYFKIINNKFRVVDL